MKKGQKTVLMLYGGRSYEHDVSVISAIQIEELWRHDDVLLLPIYLRDGSWYCVRDWRRFASYTTTSIAGRRCEPIPNGVRIAHKMYKVDCALLLTHGGEGEDGTLQALLRYYRIPYTSCGVENCALCMNKWTCKRLLMADGFPTLPATQADFAVVPPLPCILKPARLGSSLGISVVRDPAEWPDAYGKAHAYDDCVLAEEYLPMASEYTCAALGTKNEVVVSEVECPLPVGDAYSFDQKYRKDCRRQLPAAIDDALRDEIRSITRDIYTKWQLRGVVRVDFLFKDKLYVNEVNTIPGSLAYKLFAAGGMSLNTLLSHLLDNASYEPLPTPPYGSLLSDLIGAWK